MDGRPDGCARQPANWMCRCACRSNWVARGGGTNPEQLFAAGFAACFHGALVRVATKRRIRLPVDLAISASATFQRDPADGWFALTLDVEVSMPGVGVEDARELVAATEAICPYAKMAREGIGHTVRVIGTV